jgi:hypothetical protein
MLNKRAINSINEFKQLNPLIKPELAVKIVAISVLS